MCQNNYNPNDCNFFMLFDDHDKATSSVASIMRMRDGVHSNNSYDMLEWKINVLIIYNFICLVFM